MFKQIALAGNWALTIAFCLYFASYWLILLSPILHTLAYWVNPQCHANHCKPTIRYEMCQECGLQQWIRMHHCYRCGVCVHKYDHHCVLLGFCVGEANQKYYFLFLWVHLLTSMTQVYRYFMEAGKFIWMDQNGYESMETAYVVFSILIIFFTFNILITACLSFYHTKMVLVNETTYEMKKREKVKYIPLDMEHGYHPFHQGIISNLQELFTASSSRPKQWKIPQKIPRNSQRTHSETPFDRGV